MILIYVLYGYLLLGILYSVYFVGWRIRKIDDAALHASLFFSVLVFWGVVVFWPFFIGKNKIRHQ